MCTDRQIDRQDNHLILLISVKLLMKHLCKQADMFSCGQEPRTISTDRHILVLAPKVMERSTLLSSGTCCVICCMGTSVSTKPVNIILRAELRYGLTK